MLWNPYKGVLGFHLDPIASVHNGYRSFSQTNTQIHSKKHLSTVNIDFRPVLSPLWACFGLVDSSRGHKKVFRGSLGPKSQGP